MASSKQTQRLPRRKVSAEAKTVPLKAAPLAGAASLPDAGTQRLTLALSPEYVASWSSERAVAELVANAIDEDPDFQSGSKKPNFVFHWKQGSGRKDSTKGSNGKASSKGVL